MMERKTRTTIAASIAIAVAVLAWPATVFGQQVKEIGAFTDWAAYTYEEGGSKVCYIYTRAKDSDGAEGKKRGTVSLIVSHRPADKKFDEVSVNIGYSFEADSPAKAEVGGVTFHLFTRGETAWTYTKDDDKRLIGRMKAGVEITVEGQSSQGFKTVDTFSLMGFTAAYNAINRACK